MLALMLATATSFSLPAFAGTGRNAPPEKVPRRHNVTTFWLPNRCDHTGDLHLRLLRSGPGSRLMERLEDFTFVQYRTLIYCEGNWPRLAIADALGAAVEFQPPGTFEPVTGYRGGGPHGLGPGEWTDDSSMALALADSIAEAGWDIND